MGENLQIWLYPLWLCFEKCPIMAICTMATFFKILAIMDLQFMTKKKTYALSPKGIEYPPKEIENILKGFLF